MSAAIIIVFIIGYAAIAFEHPLKLNKAASALLTGVLCWTIFILGNNDHEGISHQLNEHLGEISQILFFLLGAMTIVELIDAHEGFEVITKRITTGNMRKLIWVIGLITFFLSSVLDNLTTAIVMISLLRKLIDNSRDRMLFAGIVIIAANAGGAWSPIGDVTTTMLWIEGNVTGMQLVEHLFVPSFISMIVPVFIVSLFVKGSAQRSASQLEDPALRPATTRERNIVFFTGIGALLFVPVFKELTHLPPFMGILLGLAVLWVVTEMIHSEKDEADRGALTVGYALRKIDTSSVLFFLGILIAISALQSAGHLMQMSVFMDQNIGNQDIIVLSIGALSAIIDNVPIVAAVMKMYDLTHFPIDHYFWHFLAYAAGTGGSMLIIGSAAGVAVMGMEKIDFIWYLKKISWVALLGYLAGAAVYIAQEAFLR